MPPKCKTCGVAHMMNQSCQPRTFNMPHEDPDEAAIVRPYKKVEEVDELPAITTSEDFYWEQHDSRKLNPDTVYFAMVGSRPLSVSQKANSSCGDIDYGVSISWQGYPGGVMARNTARMLAEHLLSICEQPEPVTREAPEPLGWDAEEKKERVRAKNPCERCGCDIPGTVLVQGDKPSDLYLQNCPDCNPPTNPDDVYQSNRSIG